MEINNLVDLNSLRTAPFLSSSQIKKLLEELETNIYNADWITIGIMAPSDTKAVEALKSISNKASIFFNYTQTHPVQVQDTLGRFVHLRASEGHLLGHFFFC